MQSSILKIIPAELNLHPDKVNSGPLVHGHMEGCFSVLVLKLLKFEQHVQNLIDST